MLNVLNQHWKLLNPVLLLSVAVWWLSLPLGDCYTGSKACSKIQTLLSQLFSRQNRDSHVSGVTLSAVYRQRLAVLSRETPPPTLTPCQSSTKGRGLGCNAPQQYGKCWHLVHDIKASGFIFQNNFNTNTLNNYYTLGLWLDREPSYQDHLSYGTATQTQGPPGISCKPAFSLWLLNFKRLACAAILTDSGCLV